MTKLDQNDLVEYRIFATLGEACGPFAVFLSVLYYLGVALGLLMASGALLLGAFGIL